MPTKTQLRQTMRRLRAAQNAEARAAASARLCEHLKACWMAHEFQAACVYLALPDEANIDEFIAWLLARGVPLWAPRGDDFAPLLSLEDVEVGKWGVREPREVFVGPHPRPLSQSASRERGVYAPTFRVTSNDEIGFNLGTLLPRSGLGEGMGVRAHLALFVPGLAFDKRGGRLGFGGGWYDRALAHLLARFPQETITVIGVAFAFQIVDEVPTEAHDVKMDLVMSDE